MIQERKELSEFCERCAQLDIMEIHYVKFALNPVEIVGGVANTIKWAFFLFQGQIIQE